MKIKSIISIFKNDFRIILKSIELIIIFLIPIILSILVGYYIKRSDIEEAILGSRVGNLETDGVAFLGPEIVAGRGILQIQRDLARDRERFDRQPEVHTRAAKRRWLIECERDARDQRLGQNMEQRVVGYRGKDPLRAVDGKGLSLAQVDEAGDVVDVAVGEDDGLDGAVAMAALGVGP